MFMSALSGCAPVTVSVSPLQSQEAACLDCPQVIKVDQELGAIVVHGSVPGKPGNVLEITPAKIVGINFKPNTATSVSKADAKAALEAVAA